MAAVRAWAPELARVSVQETAWVTEKASARVKEKALAQVPALVSVWASASALGVVVVERHSA